MDKVKKLLIIYYENCLRWFMPSWYQYLFSKADDPTYTTWYRRLWCRINRHPCGSWYFNPSGYEPDYTCKNCGDQLG
ncbi:hypothetical protein M0R19_09090 [Candidatus Pacearchaeota archaeon]|nr:hypothetical protein [Candidatus Pacearchaeota archaeon]